MKYAGILALPFLLSPLAQAGVAEKYNGQVGAVYSAADMGDDMTSETATVSARWYPKGVTLNSRLPAFEIDQLNGASYLSLQHDSETTEQDALDLDGSTQTLSGRLVLLNRKLFLGASAGSMSADGDSVSGSAEADGNSLELSLGVRTGQLITTLSRASSTSESEAYVGDATPTLHLADYTYDLYAIADVDSSITSLGFSWVDRTPDNSVYLIEANFHQLSLDTSLSNELYEVYTNPETGEKDAPELYSREELLQSEQTYLGADLAVTYFVQRNLGVTAGWMRMPGQSPQVFAEATVLFADRYELTPAVAVGEDTHRMLLGGKVRF